MKEVLGERTSILADFAMVHVGAAMKAVRARAWRRAAKQLRKAQAELAKAELHALEQARGAERAKVPRP